ncbi:MAG TPA: hypothetical protein PK986_01190 [Spirochaetota bacterium]|nr:hypothetical protein [Spirochaetota bacterium]HQO39058.1 hypothetical protein [Spirochaetota bacterium]
MAAEDDKKRLERQARSMMMTRDIPLRDREHLNGIMKDSHIPPEERYKKIIKLISAYPEKEFAEIPDDDELSDSGTDEPKPLNTARQKPAVTRKKNSSRQAVVPLPEDGEERYPDINGPTDTKLFISEIYARYRKFRFFRKRYLVDKNNMIGIGIDRRLIPTARFLVVMKDIHSFQEKALSRLPSILEKILGSETIESPLEYNYLRMFRKWMFNTPFATLPMSRIKWMDHWGFERELRRYVASYQSFLRMPLEHRERVLNLVESILRDEPDLKREDILPDDEKSVTTGKEKRNYEKEKYIFEYMGAVRSFMAIPGEGDSLLARHLNSRYGLHSLWDFLSMTLEAIVFQRPFAIAELRDYYSIAPANVSSTAWDCSPEKLKLFGKDPESARKRQVERIRSSLRWFDSIYGLVNLDDSGKSIPVRAADDLWRLADRVNRDAEEIYSKNFIVFLEALVKYFRDLLVPVLRGDSLTFEYGSRTVNGQLFVPEFFAGELRELETLNADIYRFRNSNPTLKISDDEIKKIMAGKISSMSHVEKLVFKTGSLFYAFADRLHQVYDGFLTGCVAKNGPQAINRPLTPEDMEQPFIPFYDSVLKETGTPTPLAGKIRDRRILTENRRGGVFVWFMAFCYQMAVVCYYPKIQDDLARREQLRFELEKFKQDDNGTEQGA